MRHDDAEPGVEQVAQSAEQAWQVPLTFSAPDGQELMQDPLEATREVEEQRVHVVEVPMQEAQVGSQAKSPSITTATDREAMHSHWFRWSLHFHWEGSTRPSMF